MAHAVPLKLTDSSTSLIARAWYIKLQKLKDVYEDRNKEDQRAWAEWDWYWNETPLLPRESWMRFRWNGDC